MVTAALVLAWMHTLVSPRDPHAFMFRDVADGIARAADEDPDPEDAAAHLVAIGYFESHYDLYAVSRADDPAEAVGAYQLSTRWLRLPASPYEQAATALWLVRDSQHRCGSLSMYASGRCDAGLPAALARERVAHRIRFETFIEVLPPALPAHRRYPSITDQGPMILMWM